MLFFTRLQHSYTEKIVVILVKPESVVEKFQRIQQPFTEHLVLVTQLCLTPWTVACWAPLSMGFPGEESWRGLPFPSPGDLPDPGPEAVSLVFPAVAGRFFTTTPPGKPPQVTT